MAVTATPVWYVPATHSEHTVAPEAALHVPATQLAQVLATLAPLAVEKSPALQRVQTLATVWLEPVA